MGKSLVREAADAFKQCDYVAALDLYKQAGNLIGRSSFKANVSLCEKRIQMSWQRKDYSNFSLKNLKVACVMDDFTFHSYDPECRLLQLTPENVIDELEQYQPDLLFIESAWRGKDELWNRKIGTLSHELKAALRWCRDHHVPTVFWNKEDPIHFETFLTTAQQFDYVFTTDIDCIARYKAALGAERVFLLPFACQPKTHNPIELYDRKDAFCFAGAYYVRYPERTRDLETYVAEFPKYKPLEIFDRNFGKDDVNYQFPPTYQPYIVGTLPFNEIDKAYKGYRYAINLNSIKQSQTMFARRVYELLGSNTITVSNFSRGVRLMFGDLVITTDSGSEVVQRLRQLDSDQSHGRKLRLAALRKVMQEHTYAHRLAYVAAKVFGQQSRDGMPHFAVLAVAKTQTMLDAILQHYERQSYANRSLLILVPKGFTSQQPITAPHVRLCDKTSVKDQTMSAVVGQADWVAVMTPEDYYGPNYLNDMALATRYTDAALVGKSAHFVLQNGAVILQDADTAYKTVATLPARSAAIRLDQVAGVPLSDWFTTWSNHQFHAENGLAIDEFSYCLNGADTAKQALVSETVDDLPGLNTGVSMADLTARAERIAPAPTDNKAALEIKGSQFAADFGKLPSDAITLKTDHNHWRIDSTLPEAKHEYLYATVDHRLADFGLTTEFKFYLDMTPGLNVQLVILFLDSKKQKISHVIKTANRNQTEDIPAGTTSIRFGLRIYGEGYAEIKSLVLGHRNLQPAEMVGQAENLILTNHYPSYDDLYRNGFVHTRVKAYRARGVRCDVFRLRTEEAVSFHEFEDVDVTTGSQEVLDKFLASGQYKNVLVHFLSPEMWTVLKRYVDSIRVVVWIHGAEIQPSHRRDFNNETEDQRTVAKMNSDKRMTFWRDLLQPIPSNLKLVFVSRSFAEDVMEDLGFRIPDQHYKIIHNPINTDLFSYQEKPIAQRKKVLSIRPYASKVYANDLSVKAIQQLSSKPYFHDLEFRLIGDGLLFEETLAPLREFRNVYIEQRFLKQDEIATLHKEYGIFLCPSRMDTQGVSRDEAMSSGLVPVTNAVAAIPEFADADCGVLAKSEDAQGLAEGIAYLYENPQQYSQLSGNAAKRVRTQSEQGKIIILELDMFNAEDLFTTSILATEK